MMVDGKQKIAHQLVLFAFVHFTIVICVSRDCMKTTYLIYRKIPKISPGAYIFERPFLRGLFLEGLIFGGAYLRREICVSKLIGLAL